MWVTFQVAGSIARPFTAIYELASKLVKTYTNFSSSINYTSYSHYLQRSTQVQCHLPLFHILADSNCIRPALSTHKRCDDWRSTIAYATLYWSPSKYQSKPVLSWVLHRADSPPQDISQACINVTSWSDKGGYLETGLLPTLYPLNGSEPNNQTTQQPAKFHSPEFTSTPGGITAVTGITISSLAFIVAAVLMMLIWCYYSFHGPAYKFTS